MSTKLRRMTTVLLTVLLLTQSTGFPAAGQSAPIDAPAPATMVDTDSPDTLYSIAGRVVDGDGNGVEGVMVTATTTDAKYPIIFLPGVMGTQLRNDLDSSDGCMGRPSGKLWVDISSADKLEPLYLNNAGDGPRNNCDRISPDGRVDWPIQPYETFILNARLAGFTVLEYPGYDWRLNLQDAVGKLDTFIDASIPTGGKVYLVAHSMGGLLARAYVADATRSEKIAHVITVGTPYLGAPLMAQRMVTGKTGSPLDWRLQPFQVKELIRYSPGIAQLLPSPGYFLNSSLPYYRTANGQSLGDYQSTIDYFTQQNHINAAIVDGAEAFHENYDGFDGSFFLAGHYTILYSEDNYATPSIFREQRCGFGSQALCVDVDNYVLGDGTVPKRSASLQWLPDIERIGVNFCSYSALLFTYKTHGDLFLDDRISSDVLQILQGEPTQHCDPHTSVLRAAAPTGFREYTVWGEGHVQVVDAEGNFTGIDEHGILVRDLDDVTYIFADGGSILTLPLDAPYQLVIHQTGSQPMQIVSSDFGLLPGRATGDEVYATQARAVFDNVPAAAGGIATVTVATAPLVQLALDVDTDANGMPEETIPPDAVLDDPLAVQDTTNPTTTLTVQGPQDGEGNFTGLATVSLSAVDEGSGVLRSYLSLNNGQSWEEYTAPAQVQAGQATAVQAYTVDKAGNQEYPPQVQELSFAAPDTTAPSTAIEVDGPQNDQGAFTGPVTVTVSAQDTQSGVQASFYSLDGGQNWQAYVAPFRVEFSQTHAIHAYSIDNVGNQETPPQVRTLTFVAPDTTAPTTTIYVDGPQNGESAFTGAVTVTISAQDTESGVRNSYYSLNAGQTWHTYDAPFRIEQGQAASIYAYSIDRTGNQEAPQVRPLVFAAQSFIYLPTVIRGAQRMAVAAAETGLLGKARAPGSPAAAITFTATTGADGRYNFANLPPGSYTVVAAKANYTLSPPSQPVTLPPDRDEVNFTASSAIALEDGLVAYYSFDDGTAVDNSGNGHDGTVFGDPVSVAGPRGSAFRFDGIDDYVEIVNSPDLNPSAMTISVWVSPLNTSRPARPGEPKHYEIVNKELQYEVAVFGESFQSASDRELAFAFNPDWYWYGGNHFVTLGEFIHIAVTFDQMHMATTYVNGVKTRERQYAASITPQNTCLRIAARGCSASYGFGAFAFFDGIIDEVKIYDRALSEGEIIALYESILVPKELGRDIDIP